MKINFFAKKNKKVEKEFKNPNILTFSHQTLNPDRPQFKKKLRLNFKSLFPKIGLILLFILVLGSFLFFKSNPLSFKKIVYENTDLSCVSNSQITQSANLNKTNIFFFNSTSESEKLQKQYPCLETIEFKKSFPQTLEVSVTQRQPAVFLKTYIYKPLNLDLTEATSSTEAAKILKDDQSSASQGQVFLVDKNGVLFDVVTDLNSALPILNYYGEELKLGYKLPEGLISNSLVAIDKLNQLLILPKEVRINNSYFVAQGDPTVKLSLTKDVNRQLISLQLILSQAKMDSKTVESVDLRFDKAVVVYSAQKR
jgi:hypothetical protein